MMGSKMFDISISRYILAIRHNNTQTMWFFSYAQYLRSRGIKVGVLNFSKTFGIINSSFASYARIATAPPNWDKGFKICVWIELVLNKCLSGVLTFFMHPLHVLPATLGHFQRPRSLSPYNWVIIIVFFKWVSHLLQMCVFLWNV